MLHRSVFYWYGSPASLEDPKYYVSLYVQYTRITCWCRQVLQIYLMRHSVDAYADVDSNFDKSYAGMRRAWSLVDDVEPSYVRRTSLCYVPQPATAATDSTIVIKVLPFECSSWMWIPDWRCPQFRQKLGEWSLVEDARCKITNSPNRQYGTTVYSKAGLLVDMSHWWRGLQFRRQWGSWRVVHPSPYGIYTVLWIYYYYKNNHNIIIL